MNGRTIARILLVLVLAGAAIGLGVTAFNAGVSTGLAQSGQVAVTPGAYPVGPYVGYGYGWGFGHGFFGFFGTLLFIFLVFALLRAAFGGRRGWGPGRPGGYGPIGGGREWRGSPWEIRAREIHDEWHKGQPDGEKPSGS